MCCCCMLYRNNERPLNSQCKGEASSSGNTSSSSFVDTPMPKCQWMRTRHLFLTDTIANELFLTQNRTNRSNLKTLEVSIGFGGKIEEGRNEYVRYAIALRDVLSVCDPLTSLTSRWRAPNQTPPSRPESFQLPSKVMIILCSCELPSSMLAMLMHLTLRNPDTCDVSAS